VKATPVWPLAAAGLVSTGAASAIVITSTALPVAVALVAEIVTLWVPPVPGAGAPLTSPLAVLTARPAGRPAALKPVCGGLVAVIW
jgi:hypothetical protein